MQELAAIKFALYMFKTLKQKKLLLIFFGAILFISCQSKKANFSVLAPKGWLTIDTVDEANQRLLKMYPSANNSTSAFRENIVVGIIQAENQQKYIESVYDKIKSQVSFFKETERGIIQVNSINADWIQYQIQITAQSDTAEQKVYYIQSRDNIFQIICSSKINEIKSISNEIDVVLKSFKVTD